jgi:ABC-2 type transport system permease protein
MRRFLMILRMMTIMMFRNRTVLFFNMALPTASFVIFGLIFQRNIVTLNQAPDALRTSYPLWLLPGMIVSNIIAAGLMGNTASMLAWRERGIFDRIAVMPMPLWQVMFARVCTQLAVIVTQAALLVLIGTLAFGFAFDLRNLPITLIFTILGSLVFLAFGQLIASAVERVEIGSLICQVVYMPLAFLTGLMIPLAILPQAIQPIARLTPSYMAVDLLRGAMLAGNGGTQPFIHIVALLGYIVAALMGSAYLSRRQLS